MPTHEGSYPPSQFRAKSARSSESSRWRPGRIAYSRLAWVFLIFYQEFYVFRSAIRSCDFKHWTDPALPQNQSIALIGDPQLVDENTYARRGIALALTKFYTDLYMRRNYRLLNQYIPLDTIIFTGDLFDGGREWEDVKWEQEYKRFQSVFPKIPDTKVVASLPGNHDIGIADGIKSSVYQRFRKHFGETSLVLSSGSWDIMILDTVALSSADPAVSSNPRTFLADWRKGAKDRPKLLVTHVPLYRAADSPCGPLRESKKSIEPRKGYQYQNVLEPAVSDEIWTTVHPSVIFAGDDHDYCDHKHDNGIHEFNVKSFSWAMGIRRPGVQLVSLSGTRYETKLCLLPDQLALFGHYGMLLLSTLLVLAWLNRREEGGRSVHGLPRTIKDDGGKDRAPRRRASMILRIVARDMLSIAWVVLAFYTFMIWW